MRDHYGGLEVRGLEVCELGNDDGSTDLIVNVTEQDDLCRVTEDLASTWTWESLTGPTTVVDEDGASEWLTLQGAKRRSAEAAA